MANQNDFSRKLIKLGKRLLVPLQEVLVVLGSIQTIYTLYVLPGGISFTRLLLLLIPTAFGLFSLLLFILSLRKNYLLEKWILSLAKQPRPARLVNFFLPIGWLLLFVFAGLPISSLGRWNPQYLRIQPILQILLLVATALWIIWMFFSREGQSELDPKNKEPILAGSILAIGILCISLIIIFTGKGIGTGTQYWGKTGVPILSWQIGVACGLMLCLTGFCRSGLFKKMSPRLFDLLIFLVFWIAAFLVWQNIPISASRYMSAAYPPNHANYPYSDASDYVLQSEAILLGNGYIDGYTDKPLHLLFLSFINFLAGGNYSTMMQFQIGIMSIMPGLLFLISTKVTNRLAGVVSGIVYIFLQSNNLQVANRIQATNVSMAMSESLAAMMLMLFCLALIAWWKKPRSSFGYPALTGAMLGLTSLVRLNVQILFPILLIIWLLFNNWKLRSTRVAMIVFMIFWILPQIPWVLRNSIVVGNPLNSFTNKVEGVIFNNRINPILNSNGKGQSVGNITDLKVESDLSDKEISGFSGLLETLIQIGFHNLVTVGLTLPDSATHLNLDETTRLSFWDQEWDGSFTPGGQFVLTGSLLMLVAGFSMGWKKNRMVVVIPFIILLSYLLANTAALVSGGRYIIPIDWVLPIYYSAGITGLILWVLNIKPTGFVETETDPGLVENKTVIIWMGVIVVLAISSLPAIVSLTIPRVYAPVNNPTIFEEIQSHNPELPANLTMEELKQFSRNGGASFKRGTAMFPRWMKTGIGDTGGAGTAFSGLPFDHLSFSMISDDYYPFDAVLPINEPVKFFPNSTDVILVGCRTKLYFDAAVVILLTPEPVVYARPDITHLTCPLPLP